MEGGALALEGMTAGIEGLVFGASLMILFGGTAGQKTTTKCVLLLWMIGVCSKALQALTYWNITEACLSFQPKVSAIDSVAFGIGSMPPFAAVLYTPDFLSTVSMVAAVVFLCLAAVLGKVFAAQLIFLHVALYRLSFLFAIVSLAKFYLPKHGERRLCV